MDEKSRENFWNTLCSISDYSEESIKKLNATFTVPDTLCRFRSVNENTLQQLQNNTQFFSSADYYDDPFDTYFKIDFQKLQSMYKLVQEMLSTENFETIRAIFSTFSINGADNSIQSMQCNPLSLGNMNQSLINVRNIIQKSIWSICFCENPLNETMWLKYASNYKGFALTYNFNSIETYLCGKDEICKQCTIKKDPPIIYPIHYSEEKYDATFYALGLITLANLSMNNNQIPPFLQNIVDLSGRWQWQRISLNKKKCHHYDEEWRMLSLVPLSNGAKIKIKPKSVIIGLRTPEYESRLIVSAAINAGIKEIHKLYINDSDELDSKPVPNDLYHV